MDLVYERRGTGSPLVLIHGIGHRWQAWEPVMDRLAESHEVIAMDLPGFGRSPVPLDGQPDGMDRTIPLMAKFFAALGVDRPHVAGNSLGGAIALELAAAGLVSSATALAPAGFYTHWERRWAMAVLRTHRLAARLPDPALLAALRWRPLCSVSYGMIMGHPERLEPRVALADAHALRDGTGFPAVARASRTYTFAGQPTVPVTIAWGTRDRIFRPHQAARARQRLPEARHVTLAGCGHVPMTDAPDLVTAVILETTGVVRAPSAGC